MQPNSAGLFRIHVPRSRGQHLYPLQPNDTQYLGPVNAVIADIFLIDVFHHPHRPKFDNRNRVICAEQEHSLSKALTLMCQALRPVRLSADSAKVLRRGKTVYKPSFSSCVYACKKITYARLRSCSPCQKFGGLWKHQNNPACTKSVRVFTMLKLGTILSK